MAFCVILWEYMCEEGLALFGEVLPSLFVFIKLIDIVSLLIVWLALAEQLVAYDAHRPNI